MTSYNIPLAPFPRYSLRQVQNRYIRLPHLRLTTWDDLRVTWICGQGTKWRRNIAETFNRLSRAHELYKQTDDRQTDRFTTTYSTRSLKTAKMKMLFWWYDITNRMRKLAHLYTVFGKKVPLYFLPQLCQIITDLQNSFTFTLSSKFCSKGVN